MAGVTFDLFVCAAKRILGLVVIEPHRLPFVLLMAGLAFRAVAAGMDILQAVTRHARTREIFVHFADVTGRAIDFFVGAFEREFCLAVVVGL